MRERKKKVSERTTEIIPKQGRAARKRKKLSGFSIFFIASATVLATAGAVGAVKSVADIPKNIKVDKRLVLKHDNNNGKEDEMEKFKGMKQEELDRAILDAANDANAEEVELLIRAGANMDTKTSMGWTPLMLASRSIMSDDAAILLISSSANLNAKNDRGMTALMIAAMTGRTTVVKALLENGADPETRDKSGRTAYDLAVQYEWKVTAELLKNHE